MGVGEKGKSRIGIFRWIIIIVTTTPTTTIIIIIINTHTQITILLRFSTGSSSSLEFNKQENHCIYTQTHCFTDFQFSSSSLSCFPVSSFFCFAIFSHVSCFVFHFPCFPVFSISQFFFPVSWFTHFPVSCSPHFPLISFLITNNPLVFTDHMKAILSELL